MIRSISTLRDVGVGENHWGAGDASCDFFYIGSAEVDWIRPAMPDLPEAIELSNGGQAVTSSRIENYLGFLMGVPGEQFAHLAVVQAQKFGARVEIVHGIELLCTQPKTNAFSVLGRQPYPFETSVPGVFAIGDIRRGFNGADGRRYRRRSKCRSVGAHGDRHDAAVRIVL